MAQSKIYPSVTDWGEDVQGIRLSIRTTNTVVESGSSITLITAITNSSTNSIRVIHTGLPSDFDISLTNRTGRLYHLTFPPDSIPMRYSVTINRGDQNVQDVAVTIGTNIATGDYTLKATRRFWVKAEAFELESNLLKVQVK